MPGLSAMSNQQHVFPVKVIACILPAIVETMRVCIREITAVVVALHMKNIADSKVPGANMGPIWGRQDPDGPHVGPMNFAIWDRPHIDKMFFYIGFLYQDKCYLQSMFSTLSHMQ